MNLIANKILIVEDDLDIQDNLKVFLEMENFEVAAAANGLQAIEHIETNEFPFLILLDLMMPVMNGYELLEEIKMRELFKEKNVSIILLSAATDIEATARAQEVKFIRKPISLNLLLSTIKQIQSEITA